VIEFECMGCGTTFDVSDSLAGKVIKCRECHQPGRVRGTATAAADGAVKTKGGDPSSPTAKWEYHCTFCGSRVLWEWKRHWTPASTVALLLGGAPVVYAFWWAFQMALGYAAANLDEKGTVRVSGAYVTGAFVLLCVAVTAAVMGFRLLWEWRQECPRCGVRVG
jgi:DNA-directed RNA polymerase subunit RPC12/RpoP